MHTDVVYISNPPLSVFMLISAVAIILSAYTLIRNDRDYYTHMITCILSAFMFGVSSYIAFGGISGEVTPFGAVPNDHLVVSLYQIPSLGYLFAGAAVIMVMYFFMRLYDIYQEHADAGWMKQ